MASRLKGLANGIGQIERHSKTKSGEHLTLHNVKLPINYGWMPMTSSNLAKTFLGIAILNHVVSAIDARIAAKSYNRKQSSLGLDLQTSVSPHNVESRLVLQKRF